MEAGGGPAQVLFPDLAGPLPGSAVMAVRHGPAALAGEGIGKDPPASLPFLTETHLLIFPKLRTLKH